MASEAEEAQLTQAINDLTQYSKILVKKYPLIFKDGSGAIILVPTTQPTFQYWVRLSIKKKE